MTDETLRERIFACLAVTKNVAGQLTADDPTRIVERILTLIHQHDKERDELWIQVAKTALSQEKHIARLAIEAIQEVKDGFSPLTTHKEP